MFDAWELHDDGATRRRMGVALVGAVAVLAALSLAIGFLASRPVVEAPRKKEVDVSFRPPPPPPVKVEPPPPLPRVKPPPPPKPVVVEAPPAPAPAPAPAPMVAPKEIPKVAAPESDTAVAAVELAVGGTGDGTGAAVGASAPDEDESPAPVVAKPGGTGPVTLPEDADPPEPSDDNAQPEYPESARTTGEEAKVVLKIVVEQDGRVGRIQVLKGAEPFVAAAIAAVQTWTYEPARLEGEPLAVFKIVNITFALRD